MWEPLQATSDPGRGLPLLVGPLWWKGYRPRVRPKREPKGTKRLRDHMGCSQEAPDPGNKARRTVPRQNREAPRRQRGLPGAVGPPHRPRPMGGPMVGGSKVVGSRNHPDQQPSPSCSILSRRWVALATLLLVA